MVQSIPPGRRTASPVEGLCTGVRIVENPSLRAQLTQVLDDYFAAVKQSRVSDGRVRAVWEHSAIAALGNADTVHRCLGLCGDCIVNLGCGALAGDGQILWQAFERLATRRNFQRQGRHVRRESPRLWCNQLLVIQFNSCEERFDFEFEAAFPAAIDHVSQ